MPFNPRGNEELSLGGRSYRVRPLSSSGPLAVKAMRMVGGRAQVYQLVEFSTGQPFALKVMLPAFRAPQLVRNAKLLAQLALIPGFEACRQTYVTSEGYAEDLSHYPDLEYASLMPWINGATWAMLMNDPGVKIDSATSWEIAYQLVRLVRLLERQRMAHCDLSGGNLIVAPDIRRLTLIDFDDLYWPQAPVPVVQPTGTPGYRKWGGGQWSGEGDRFGLAILVTEMLGWRDERLRALSSGDSYFTEADFHEQSPERYLVARSVLHESHPSLEQLLERAWTATSNSECPTAEEWRLAIIAGRQWSALPVDPLDRVRITFTSIIAQDTQPGEDSGLLGHKLAPKQTHDLNPVLPDTVEDREGPNRALQLGPGVAVRRYVSSRGLLISLAILSGLILLLGLALMVADLGLLSSR